MGFLIFIALAGLLVWRINKKRTKIKSQIQPEKRICQQCGSPNLFIDKAGYSAGQGCLGALLLGPFGLLCGQSKANQLRVTCLDCRYQAPL